MVTGEDRSRVDDGLGCGLNWHNCQISPLDSIEASASINSTISHALSSEFGEDLGELRLRHIVECEQRGDDEAIGHEIWWS